MLKTTLLTIIVFLWVYMPLSIVQKGEMPRPNNYKPSIGGSHALNIFFRIGPSELAFKALGTYIHPQYGYYNCNSDKEEIKRVYPNLIAECVRIQRGEI